jgi:hypothetical protein
VIIYFRPKATEETHAYDREEATGSPSGPSPATSNVLIGIDLDPAKRPSYLGFTMSRTNVATNEARFLPNRITFASTPENTKLDTSNSLLQKFRWSDYTTQPGTKSAIPSPRATGSRGS